jgi:hypothetical protein
MKNIKEYKSFVNEAKSINEGLIGKIAKFISKKEYNKLLSHIQDIKDDETEDFNVESIVKDMTKDLIKKLLTGKTESFKSDKFIKSLTEEIKKDLK